MHVISDIISFKLLLTFNFITNFYTFNQELKELKGIKTQFEIK